MQATSISITLAIIVAGPIFSGCLATNDSTEIYAEFSLAPISFSASFVHETNSQFNFNLTTDTTMIRSPMGNKIPAISSHYMVDKPYSAPGWNHHEPINYFDSCGTHLWSSNGANLVRSSEQQFFPIFSLFGLNGTANSNPTPWLHNGWSGFFTAINKTNVQIDVFTTSGNWSFNYITTSNIPTIVSQANNGTTRNFSVETGQESKVEPHSCQTKPSTHQWSRSGPGPEHRWFLHTNTAVNQSLLLDSQFQEFADKNPDWFVSSATWTRDPELEQTLIANLILEISAAGRSEILSIPCFVDVNSPATPTAVCGPSNSLNYDGQAIRPNKASFPLDDWKLVDDILGQCIATSTLSISMEITLKLNSCANGVFKPSIIYSLSVGKYTYIDHPEAQSIIHPSNIQ
jgi:hypothetical protein